MSKQSKNTCPDHGTSLVCKKTRFGDRFGCPEPGCTVVRWDGSTSTPADLKTRNLRQQCHQRFDPLWKGKGGPFRATNRGPRDRRVVAYKWLAKSVGVPFSEAHFGMFNADQCERALRAIEELLSEVTA